jgi:hypothetical protein
MRNRYWHDRCERWGSWRVGSRGASGAPWARMRNGTPMTSEDSHLPELHIEERETDEMIALMPDDIAAFLRLVYPWQARIANRVGLNRNTFNERLNVAHRMLSRMLDQRRRGEPIDAGRRRPRHRIKALATRDGKGRRKVLAATQQE